MQTTLSFFRKHACFGDTHLHYCIMKQLCFPSPKGPLHRCCPSENQCSKRIATTYRVAVFDPLNLLVEFQQFVKRLSSDDREHEDESLSVLHVQVPHGCKLLCPSCIENFEHALLSIHLDLLSVGIFDGRVISIHENGLYKLNRLDDQKVDMCVRMMLSSEKGEAGDLYSMRGKTCYVVRPW